MASRAMAAWREKQADERAVKAERRQTCDHEGTRRRGEDGCIGGTWRTYCDWCDELLHDTLWDL